MFIYILIFLNSNVNPIKRLGKDLIKIDQTKKMTDEIKKGSKPVLKVRAGSISASVFKNEAKTKDGRDISFDKISVQNAYKDEKGEWQNTNSFDLGDIPRLVCVLERVYNERGIKIENA